MRTLVRNRLKDRFRSLVLDKYDTFIENSILRIKTKIKKIARTSLLNKLQCGKIKNFIHPSKALQQNSIFPVVKIC